jgi:phosphatidylinositol-3-phosphatase
MRLLALVSALATGLVLWAGLGRDEPRGIAAAVAYRDRLLASDAAAAAAAQSANGFAQTPPATSEAAAEANPAPESAGAGGSSVPSEPAAASPERSESASPQAAASTPPPTVSPNTGKSTTGTAPTETKIKHVFVITLASPGYEQTWGTGSAAHYLTTELRPRGTLLSNYYAIAHLDLPNYIAMISGQPANPQTAADCPTFAEFPASKPDASGRIDAPGCVYPVSVLTLADQLTSSRRQWRAYIEDLANGPKPVQSCRHPNSNQPDETQHARPGDAYAARHNPFVYFHSLLDLGDCASDDLPLTRLGADLSSPAKTPNYAFIAPNLCHSGSEATCVDGSPGGLQAADAFLAEWVPRILASPAYSRDGLLVITFGEGAANDTSGCCAPVPGASTSAPASVGGGRVGALLLSRYVKPGGESASPYNHYSLLRTIEDIFGVAHLANASQSGVESFSGTVLEGVFGHK